MHGTDKLRTEPRRRTEDAGDGRWDSPCFVSRWRGKGRGMSSSHVDSPRPVRGTREGRVEEDSAVGRRIPGHGIHRRDNGGRKLPAVGKVSFFHGSPQHATDKSVEGSENRNIPLSTLSSSLFCLWVSLCPVLSLTLSLRLSLSDLPPSIPTVTSGNTGESRGARSADGRRPDGTRSPEVGPRGRGTVEISGPLGKF